MTQIEVRFYELASSFFSKMLHPSKAKDDIDWEQRRYEIAKELYCRNNDYFRTRPKESVEYAEKLIAELKK